MAPNDIPVGKKYAQVINTAIKNSDCVVLLLSDAAQKSPWVPKEVERAINYQKMIIPIKVEDVVLNDEFELYISTDQIVAVKQFDESLPEVQKILKSVAIACGVTFDGTPTSEETKNTDFAEKYNVFAQKAIYISKIICCNKEKPEWMRGLS